MNEEYDFNITHEAFLVTYVLNRTKAVGEFLDGQQLAKEAEKAWKEIQKSIRKDKD